MVPTPARATHVVPTPPRIDPEEAQRAFDWALIYRLPAQFGDRERYGAAAQQHVEQANRAAARGDVAAYQRELDILRRLSVEVRQLADRLENQ